MSSKRAQKAQKRAQRQDKRQTRRARGAAKAKKKAEKNAVERNPLIGYLVHDGVRVLCDGDGCVIAGSKDKIRQIRDRFGSRFAAMNTIQPAPFSDIWAGLQGSGAYCFDEEAYGRFLAPSRCVGMTLTDEDFSDPGPLGMHFVRVQLLNIDR